MNNERARLLTRPVDTIPLIPARRGTEPTSQLSSALAGVLALGWPAVVALSMLLEPAPDGPGAETSAPLAVELASFVTFVAIVATIVAALRRRRTAALWSAGAGSVALALSLSCPVSGHHAYAAWWYAELAMIAAMLWVSATAWRRGRNVGVH